MPKELVVAPRKQVLVVVTTDLHVLCLDHNLKPMWQKHLLKHFTSTPHGTIRELAIHISEHAINKGDKGVIVIGASVTPQTLGDREDNEDALDAEMDAEAMAKLHAKGRQFGQGTRDIETTTTGRHFSYFAFEGSKGEDRWQHDAGDWHRDMGALADETMDQHSYHMKAERENAMHYGEASCKDYREAVLAAFPHSWSSFRDTRFKLAHFHKHRSGKGAQKELLTKLASGSSGSGVDRKDPTTGTTTSSTTSNSVVGRVVGSLVNGAARGARRGSNGNTGDVITGGVDLLKNHTSAPNVLVTYLEEGLEAIHLYSGRTVCRLFLSNPGLHADLNKDGIPDHIIAIGGSPRSLQQDGAMDAVDAEHHHFHRHHGFCYAVVKSGIPARQHLFDGGICRPFTGGLHGLDRVNQLRPVDVATPVLLPVPGRRGKYRRGGGNLAVFLNSRGEVTSYDGQGHKVWQVRTGAGWLGGGGHHWGEEDGDEDQDEEMHAQEARGGRRGRGGQWHVEPTLVAMPLRTHAIPTVILAGGGDAFVAISERGRIVDQFDLPATPDQPLVITDFNFDGLNDIVMVSSDGIYGWTQVRRPGALPFSALVGGLIVIMVAVWINQQGFMKGGGGGGGGGGSGRRKGRSTDRVD